ncbi:hypothetical protein CEE37_03865 [candidate division LCP-89 bacterium B3_LCP]|uniref:DUF4175 domain-containing protein n=1 Tax=candidate division LCP-89 bacterium B3_LCP TaxID=2012998 RepID=A0A532V3D5_UNCL8|nr:MAG: hypothetical protein CEE37_03865 [candidate division LCP-89 bacterium B3_LCP]
MDWDLKIRERLKSLRRKILFYDLFDGWWRILGISLLLILAITQLEMLLQLDPPLRLPVVLFIITLIGIILVTWLLVPLIRFILRPKSSEELALTWGYSLDGINDRLLNAMQVYEGRTTESTSSDLAEMSLAVIADELEGASFDNVFDRIRIKKVRNFSFLILSAWLLVFLISGSSFTGALYRLAYPQVDFRPPDPFSLALIDVPEHVVRGEPFTISVSGTGDLPADISIVINEESTDPKAFDAQFDSTGIADYSLPNPQNDMYLYAYSGRVTSDTAFIAVKTRPFIKELQVKWFPPKYSKLPSSSSTGKRGDVAALKGSRVVLEIEVDRQLSQADLLIFRDEDPEDSVLINMILDGHFATSEFKLLKNGYYNILIQDHDGIENGERVNYNLWPIQDEWPVVSIFYPPPEAEFNESLMVPLKVGARDDFAISRFRIGRKLIKGGVADTSEEGKFIWKKLPFESFDDGTSLVDMLMDFNDMNLLPGDVLQYKMDVLDNDRISGPKRAETPVQELRFPTLKEIFARMEEGHGEQVEDIRETLEKSRLLKEELEALQEELKRNPELSWEEKQDVQEMLKKQEEMAQKTDEMAEQIEKMIQKMEENNLFTPETMAKYQELQRLMQDIMSPELAKAMQKLQESLKQQDPENLRRAVEEFSLSQEEFLERMEKTMNILKQLQMEMKLDELAKRAQEMLEKQEEINEALSDSAKEGSQPEQAQAESELKEDMEEFQKEFEKTKELLEESPHNPEESMSDAEKLLEESQFADAMSQMSQELMQGDLSSAQQQGGEIKEGLSQLAQTMQQAKNQMMESSKSKLAEALKKVSHDLLSLSYQQEDLLSESGEIDRASPRFRSMAQKQEQLRSHLEKTSEELFKLSQESFFITPQIGTALNQAFHGMDQAISGYTARTPRSVSRQQESAMGGLNRAVMEIGQSLDQLSSSSSSTGYAEMMEQLAQMAGQQGQINQGTMSLIPGGTNPGQFSLQQQAAMSRLAAQQEALRQQMDNLSQSSQQISETMGRLGDLSKEMQEIVDDLKNRQIDERTLKRQERILRRLLDAQKSVREREYRRERLSRTAEGPYQGPSPDELNISMTQDEMREKLLRALREGYTKDYQKLIRDYFEALARDQ